MVLVLYHRRNVLWSSTPVLVLPVVVVVQCFIVLHVLQYKLAVGNFYGLFDAIRDEGVLTDVGVSFPRCRLYGLGAFHT